MQTVQSFYFGELDLYSHTLVFFISLKEPLCSYIHFKGITHSYGYQLNNIDPLATGSNTNHMFLVGLLSLCVFVLLRVFHNK